MFSRAKGKPIKQSDKPAGDGYFDQAKGLGKPEDYKRKQEVGDKGKDEERSPERPVMINN